MNSRASELEFVSSILQDLSMNYPEHNEKVLYQLIDIIRYRIITEEICAEDLKKKKESDAKKFL